MGYRNIRWSENLAEGLQSMRLKQKASFSQLHSYREAPKRNHKAVIAELT